MRVVTILVMFLILSILVPTVAAVSYTPINHVSDYAEIIDEDFEAQINALADEIEQSTTVEIAVLTIPSLEGGDIDQFAVETFEEWGVGQKDVNNGLLMVIAVEDRKWRIEVGYGLESVITDAMAGRIGRENFVENFRAEKYGQGIYGAILDVKGFVENDSSVISAYAGYDNDAGYDYENPLGFTLLNRILLSFFVFSALGIFEFLGIVIQDYGAWFMYFFLSPFWAIFPLILFGPYVGVGLLIMHLVCFPIIKKIGKKRGWARKLNSTRIKGGRFGGNGGSNSQSSSSGFGGGGSGGGGSSGGW